jgi:hypothetical protein
MTLGNPSITTDTNRQGFLDELDASLRQRPDLDASERETILRHFEDAFDRAQTGDGQATDTQASWSEMFESLQQNNVLSDMEVKQLNEQFGSLDEIMQSDAARMALQFNKLRQKAGAEQAREWLAQQLQQQS